MPKTVAVICEYNPFHNGHKLQADIIRRAYPESRIIAIMSGNVVQRGETAVLPKHLRAEAAVRCGIDLVLELPYPYSGAAAEYFATGAVRLIADLGCVDVLCFGSENGDIVSLEKTAEAMISQAYIDEYERLKTSEGGKERSRLSLCEEAYSNLFGSDSFPKNPNDILAIEYIKALKKWGEDIEPFTYKRMPGFSAGESRGTLKSGDFSALSEMVPSEAFELYKSYGGGDSLENASGIVLAALRLFGDRCDMSSCSCAGGGIYSLLKNSADKAVDLESLLSLCSGKRYTDANIRRAIISMLLGTTPNMLAEKPLFTNVLAANGSGRKLLSKMRKTAMIKLFTKPSHFKKAEDEVIRQFERSLCADKLYLLTAKQKMSTEELLKLSPYIKE